MQTPAFISAFPLPLSRNSAHSSLLKSPRSILQLRTQTHTRCTPTAQLGAGNINDVPAERIPESPDAIPAYWNRPGVYGIYNSEKDLQYVAAALDVGKAIQTHIKTIQQPEKHFAVRMLTVENVDDAPLDTLAENWVVAHYSEGPGVPPGNSDEEPFWRVEEFVQQEDVYLVPGTPVKFIEMEIRRVLRENRIVLFMKGVRKEPLCGFSKAAVQILEAMEAEFCCVDVLDEVRNTNLREGIKKFSEWPTIPQLYVDGEFIGGAEIVHTMYESGELSSVLNPETPKDQ